jgi:hypothetical protein
MASNGRGRNLLKTITATLQTENASIKLICYVLTTASVVQWSEVRFRFPALSDFPKSSVSGTGSTQPREHN